MITEEKLQTFLDDLRIGKYDNFNYHIAYRYGGLLFKDIGKNVSFELQTHSVRIPILTQKSGLSKLLPTRGKKYEQTKTKFYIKVLSIIDTNTLTYLPYYQDIQVSEDLFKSWNLYISEQREKEILIFKSNLESSFGL